MGHGHTAVSASGRHLGRLTAAFTITAVFTVVELVVGLTTGSLALISDAAHMLTDVIGVGLALLAIAAARRAPDRPHQTYGRYRAEVLAALANAVLLFAVAAYVVVTAISRLAHPPPVPGLPVLIAASLGLLANVASFLLLRKGSAESLNIRGAYLEVLSDLIGSLGVLLSALITLLFGWRYADPLIGVAIGLFVLPRTWSLARRSLHILFQHAPDRVDIPEMATALGGLTGVTGVHDLHVWTLTSGMEVLSAHLTLCDGADQDAVLRAARGLLATRYRIEHATLQCESRGMSAGCQEMSW